MTPEQFAHIMRLVAVGALPVIFAITLHEAAHGYVAYKLGDDTAWKMGRVTFNPLRHIDLFGTIVMPLVLFITSAQFGQPIVFGYAKPVPVRFDRLARPRRDMVWVALAGPATNIVLATLSAAILAALIGAFGVLISGMSDGPHLRGVLGEWTEANLRASIGFNILIAAFNMIPLPPLDGGRVAVGILPDTLAIPLARSERYGMVLLIALLLLFPMLGQRIGVDLNVVWWVIERPVEWLYTFIGWMTGLPA